MGLRLNLKSRKIRHTKISKSIISRPLHLIESALEEGEFIEVIEGLNPAPYRTLYLSGFSDQENYVDYEKGECGGEGSVLVGFYGGDDPTSAGLRIFRSPQLVGLDACGMSGGLSQVVRTATSH